MFNCWSACHCASSQVLTFKRLNEQIMFSISSVIFKTFQFSLKATFNFGLQESFHSLTEWMGWANRWDRVARVSQLLKHSLYDHRQRSTSTHHHHHPLFLLHPRLVIRSKWHFLLIVSFLWIKNEFDWCFDNRSTSKESWTNGINRWARWLKLVDLNFNSKSSLWKRLTVCFYFQSEPKSRSSQFRMKLQNK